LFVKREFQRFVRCGVLAHGFARFRCADCGVDYQPPVPVNMIASVNSHRAYPPHLLWCETREFVARRYGTLIAHLDGRSLAMTNLVPRHLMAFFLLLQLGSGPRGALAHDEKASFALTYDTPDPTTQAMESAERRIRRGRRGLIFSSIITAGGAAMVGLGVADNFTFGEPILGIFVPGTIAIVAGVAGMLVSGVALGDGRREKRRTERRGAELLLSPAGATVRLRF